MVSVSILAKKLVSQSNSSLCWLHQTVIDLHASHKNPKLTQLEIAEAANTNEWVTQMSIP